MRRLYSLRGLAAAIVLGAVFALIAVDFAEARRGGGFGSRGMRTFDNAAPTRTAPREAAPVNRSMTPRQQANQPAAAQGNRATTPRQGGMFGGMAGGLLGGLFLGGMIGLLMGNGLGGMAGLLGLFLQIALAVLVISLIMRFFRSQRRPAYAGASGSTGAPAATPFEGLAGGGQSTAAAPAVRGGDEIGITPEDLDRFEALLTEIQAAFTREDFGALRERCTPEIVSFLSEEISQNAVDGVRNDVTDVRLLQGDVAEAWREGSDEYATVAMRYESIDVMRDRETGAVVEGDETPTEIVEVWTFVRPAGGDWALSAIQDV